MLSEKLRMLDCLSLIHIFMESLPQAVLQAGAIVVKSVVNNDRQCFHNKDIIESWIQQKFYDMLGENIAFCWAGAE